MKAKSYDNKEFKQGQKVDIEVIKPVVSQEPESQKGADIESAENKNG